MITQKLNLNDLENLRDKPRDKLHSAYRKVKHKIWPTPVAMTAEGWDKWENDKKSKYPIRFFLFEDLPVYFSVYIKRPIKDLYWYIRHRTFDRYHVIKTNLEPGYYDVDTLMLESCFKLLERFVDEEDGLNFIDWSWNEDHKNIEKEIVFLLNWYRGRKERERIWDANNPTPEFRNEFKNIKIWGYITPEFSEWAKKRNEAEIKWQEEDTEMMIRLVKIRKFLWI